MISNLINIRLAAEAAKRSTSPLAFFKSELGDLRGNGRWRDGVGCPFCNDGKRDNFRINVEEGGFCCLKCGFKGGDIIDFTMKRYGLPFIEAIKKITGGKAIEPDPEFIKLRESVLWEAERQKRIDHAKTTKESQEIWAGSEIITDPSCWFYFHEKRIGAHGARISRAHRYPGWNVIPKIVDDAIAGLQFIANFRGSDGKIPKRNLGVGLQALGAYFAIGDATDKILVAEGFATAATLHEQTGKMCVVAFGTGGLIPVAKVIRAKYTDAGIIICGDNDSHGKGQRAANEAARAIGGKVFIPPEPGDWNDYVCQGGIIDG